MANGIPKPPKGKKYDSAANDWMAGEMEAEMEKDRKKAKPAPRKASAPDFIPGADYEKEFNTYVDRRDSQGRSYTPRNRPGFSPSRNDTDLAAQSVIDHNMSGRAPKQRGGGPGQRPGINMINNLKHVKRYAKGGSVSSRADGCCSKGKTKGRFV